MNDKAKQWIALEQRRCAHNYHPLPVVLTKGQGVWVWDVHEKRYLDMMSAYSAVSLGHAHPYLIKALEEQAQKLAVVSRAYYTDRLPKFLDKLCQVSGFDMALPMNTGAEAVETALKAARRWGYEKKGIAPNQAQIIVASNNFHGRTISIISFSSDYEYKKNFGPFTPGFIEVEYGNSDALEESINENTCAFLVEPIQGEAGIVVPPSGWLKECQRICKKHNVLLILDEIQSGLGRTGKWFAFEHEHIKPDALILGKALGGGLLPVSAFLANRSVMDVFVPGSHGSTFGGNPLAAAVGLAVLEVLEKEDLISRSEKLGKILRDEIRGLKHPLITDVRGKGLWVGIEIDDNVATARQVCEKLIEKGILSKETHDTVVRFAPPLVIQEKELYWAVEQLNHVLDEISP